MAQHWSLPGNLVAWKVKLRDKERVEPPHVTILRGTKAWRWGLRNKTFLDREPPVREIPGDLLKFLESHHDAFVQVWDVMYPENPVWTRKEKP